MGWGELNRKCQVSNRFFFLGGGGGGGAPKTPTAINTCLDEMKEFKGRDIAFVSDWVTKKRSLKVRVLKS